LTSIPNITFVIQFKQKRVAVTELCKFYQRYLITINP